jgi:hypothetical protein
MSCAATRKGTAALEAIAVALLIGACGGTHPTNTSTSGQHNAAGSAESRTLAFAQCMRSHGVRHYPDPSRSGTFDKTKLTTQQLGVGASVIRSAGNACQRLYPTSSQSSQTQDQTMMAAMFKFARCVRAHGVPNWPDPVAESDPGQPNTPGFPRNMPNINQDSPQVKKATRTCQHLMAGIGYGSGGYP